MNCDFWFVLFNALNTITVVANGTGLRCGYGKLVLENGDVYDGEWEDGLKVEVKLFRVDVGISSFIFLNTKSIIVKY